MRYYSNTSKDMTLTGAIDTVVTSMTVDDASGLPLQFPYNLAIDAGLSSVEIVEVTAAAGNVLTIVRGQQDTAGKPHSVGAVVYHAWTALEGQELQNHMAASQNVHGVGATAAIVGTNTTQTLTNKSINGNDNTITNIPSSAIAALDGSKITSVITVATIPADNVTGPYDNITVRQEAAGTVGLDATVHASATQPNVRIAGAVSQDALQINRNNATTTGNLLHLRTETGTTLATINRSGNMIVGDLNSNGSIIALGGISSFSGVQGANVTSTGNFKIGTRNVDDETVRRFATVAARTAAMATPTVGQETWTDEKRVFEGYAGGAWRALVGVGCLVANSTYDAELASGASANPNGWSILSPPTDPANWSASGTTITCLTAGIYMITARCPIGTDVAPTGTIATGRMSLSMSAGPDFGPTDGFVRSGLGDGAINFTFVASLSAGETVIPTVTSGNTNVRFYTPQIMALRLA